MLPTSLRSQAFVSAKPTNVDSIPPVRFPPHTNARATESENSPPLVLSSTPRPITIPPSNIRSIHELSHCRQGWRFFEKKAAQTLSVAAFPWRRHLETGHLRHPTCDSQTLLAKVMAKPNPPEREAQSELADRPSGPTSGFCHHSFSNSSNLLNCTSTILSRALRSAPSIRIQSKRVRDDRRNALLTVAVFRKRSPTVRSTDFRTFSHDLRTDPGWGIAFNAK
jgi:hypothetical protein